MYELEFKRHDEEEVLEVKVTGKLNLESAIEISSKSREKAHELGYHLLKDLSEVELDGGIIQTHGRIMIITTNHPEKLDPALVRAGRIDLKLNFGLCDTQQIRGLFFNFFERDPPDNTIFQEGVCSPADITSILLEYKDTPDIGWEKVKEKFIDGIQDAGGSPVYSQ